MFKRVRRAYHWGAITGLLALPAQAAPVPGPPPAQFAVFAAPDSRIDGIRFESSRKLSVVEAPNFRPEQPVYQVVLRGLFTVPNASLLSGEHEIPLAPGGKFQLTITLAGDRTNVQLTAVLPTGAAQRLRGIISAPGLGAYGANVTRLAKQDKQRPKPWTITPSLGITDLAYTQTTGQGQITSAELLGTLKLDFRYWFSLPNWSFDLGTYYSMFALSHKVVSTIASALPASDALRFFGANGRVGYSFDRAPSSRWAWTISGGIYYATSLGTGSSTTAIYGFRNQTGPQVVPGFGYDLGGGSRLTGYVKGALITQGLSLVSLKSYEAAVGLAWRRTLANGHLFSVGLDVAQLHITQEDTQILSRTYSLGAGYSF